MTWYQSSPPSDIRSPARLNDFVSESQPLAEPTNICNTSPYYLVCLRSIFYPVRNLDLCSRISTFTISTSVLKMSNTVLTPLQGQLQELRPTTSQTCATLGVPGLAIGVIHEGKVIIHEDDHGYRDVEARLLRLARRPVFHLGSLTKAMASAAVSVKILVDKGAMS